MSGWITLQRGWFRNEIFADEPLTEREAWHWLIEHAAWKKCVRRSAKGERIEVERGQFHTSLRNLGAAWSWGKNRVARYLARLEDAAMIGTVAGQSGILITLCNYAKYQDMRDSLTLESGTVAGQSRDTQEQGKPIIPFSNEKGGVEISPEKRFWDSAKSYLVQTGKSEPQARSLVGKWLRDHGKDLTQAALNSAQCQQAVDPVSYCTGYFRKHGKQASEEYTFGI